MSKPKIYKPPIMPEAYLVSESQIDKLATDFMAKPQLERIAILKSMGQNLGKRALMERILRRINQHEHK